MICLCLCVPFFIELGDYYLEDSNETWQKDLEGILYRRIRRHLRRAQLATNQYPMTHLSACGVSVSSVKAALR